MRLLTGSNETFQDLDLVASLGAEGKYPNNINKELMAKLGGINISEPLQVDMPMLTRSKEFRIQNHQKLLLPHTVFSDLYNNYPAAWRDRVLPSTAKLNEFWREMEDSPALANHPVKQIPNWQSRAIPISIHTDAVPVTGVGKTWGKSVDVYSWCSLLGRGSTLEFNFYIWSIFSKLVCTMNLFSTKKKFWRIFVWSLQTLLDGRWPTHDWNGNLLTDPISILRAGTPLAGRLGEHFVAVVWLIRGDLDAFNKEYMLPNSGRNDHPCCFCPGNASAFMNAFEFREGLCKWLPKIYTKANWIYSQFCKHLLFTTTALGVTILHVSADWMHNKNLGTDQYFYGSVMFMLCYNVLPGTNYEFRNV